MSQERFDLCILGAGPAGYAAAMRALDLGKKVLLVERDRVGGAGIHHGALSSKTMWHLSNDYACTCRTDRGYVVRDVALSYGAVMETVRAAVSERRGVLEHQVTALGAMTLADGARLAFRRGRGRFVSPHAVDVTGESGSEHFEADHFLVATGSRPRIPPNIEVDGQLVVTSDHIESWDDFPRSMVIVGAGVVGCEYAAIFGNFGRTEIHVIDQQPRILPFEDEDVSGVVASRFREMGIVVHSESRLVSLRVVDGRSGPEVEFVLRNAQSGERAPIRVERALISVGRVPATDDLGLDAAGVQVAQNGGIVIDEGTRTTAPHIHAAGDTTLDIALANVAELEGRHAVEEMFGLSPAPIHYEALTSIMFLAPELAAVGLNEQQARKKGIRYRYGVVSNQLVNRAIAMRSTDGFVKLLAEPASGKILGVRVIGPQASSTAQGVALLIDHRGTLADIDRCIHPHPAIPEAVQECARLLLGCSVHKLAVFGDRYLRLGDG